MKSLSLHRQPITGLYIGYSILVGLTTFPFYCLYYISSSNRPRIEYSWSQAIFLSIIRRAVDVIGNGRISPKEADPSYKFNPQSLKKSVMVEIDSMDLNRLTGVLKDFASKIGMEEMKIRGYLFHNKGKNRNPTGWKPFMEKPQKDEKIIMALHGGGYVMGAAHELFHSTTAPMLQQYIKRNATVFSIEYRLAEKYPFPTGLFDAISAYVFLVERAGYDPKQIILEGDSAGGNLALGLCRYLKETQMLPLPSALLLVSPGVDRTFSHRDDPTLSYKGQDPSQLADLLTPALQNWTSNAYSGYGTLPKEELFESPYVSPGSVTNLKLKEDFVGYPPCFMSIGEFESYRAEQVALLQTIKECNGNLGGGSRLERIQNGNEDDLDSSSDDGNRSISVSMDQSSYVDLGSKVHLNSNPQSSNPSNSNYRTNLNSNATSSSNFYSKSSSPTEQRQDKLQIIKGAPHDSTVLPSIFFEPYTTSAKKEIARWIDSLE